MDGFPLDMDQASEFQRLIGFPDCIVHLNINADVMKERLRKRGNFDDSDESIDKRIKTYLQKTRPLIEKFNVIKIEADKPADAVFKETLEVLENDHALKLFETVHLA